MRANSKDPQPVRLANPTAESFVASLKVVHFFAILFFWLALVSLVLHIAAFVVFQAGAFDEVLGVGSEEVSESAPAEGEGAEAATEAESAPDEEAPWWSRQQAQRSQHYVTQLMATMRLIGLLASILLLVTLFVYLEISLLGRLAGVKYLTMSFFLMLFFVATVYSWEPLLPGTRILGSLYVLDDFVKSYAQRSPSRPWGEAMYHYGRFLVMPILSLLLLVFSWLRFRKGYEESVLMNE